MGVDGSHDRKFAMSGDGAREPQACAKPAKGEGLGDGCNSAVVASDRVGCGDESDFRRRLRESAGEAGAEAEYMDLRDNAGQSHGKVNCCAAMRADPSRASLRNVVRAARDSIVVVGVGTVPLEIVYGVSNKQERKERIKSQAGTLRLLW